MLNYRVKLIHYNIRKQRNKSIEKNQKRDRCERPTKPSGEAKRKNNPVVRGEEFCPENSGGAIGKTNTIEREPTKNL